MSVLICPICGASLKEDGKSLLCPKNHRYDVSKEGYVNLLPPAHGQHGDNKLMINARRHYLEGGYYADLREAVSAKIRENAKADCTLLDVGCGEGYYTEKMASAVFAKGGALYGFDISRDAVRLAAKRGCGCFFVGSAYKMPIESESVDLLTLLFSPFCREEILRVLKKDGIFLMVIPGAKHLYGLKSVLYDTPYLNQVQDTKIDGFALVEQVHIEKEITVLGKEDIEALFSMTPYYYKTSPRDKEKLSSLSALSTQTEFELLLYKKI